MGPALGCWRQGGPGVNWSLVGCSDRRASPAAGTASRRRPGVLVELDARTRGKGLTPVRDGDHAGRVCLGARGVRDGHPDRWASPLRCVPPPPGRVCPGASVGGADRGASAAHGAERPARAQGAGSAVYHGDARSVHNPAGLARRHGSHGAAAGRRRQGRGSRRSSPGIRIAAPHRRRRGSSAWCDGYQTAPMDSSVRAGPGARRSKLLGAPDLHRGGEGHSARNVFTGHPGSEGGSGRE